MKSTSDIGKELKRKKAEIEKTEKAYCKSKANDVLKNANLNNEEVCKMYASMPSSEAVILLNEVLNSEMFLSISRSASENSTRLKRIRASVAAKAERRKAKKAQSEQTDILQVAGPAISSEANGTEEAVPQSEQAELSEQNTQSDSFANTAAETPTDFSQKWDQVNSLEQTEPPAYPGSVY